MLPILALAAVFVGSEADAQTAAPITLVGEVAPLADVLEKRKIPHDPDAKNALVLVLKDEKFVPLVKNEASRLFYLDKRLLHRPMQLTGSYVPGSEMFNVAQVRSVKAGILHEIYYWCDKCQLRFAHAGPCSCCGGDTELWEDPVVSTLPRKSP